MNERRPSTTNPRTRTGFTLVELLVVIAVIALLAAMVVPALGKAKTQAQRTACLNKLRQWGLALNMYADENGGNTPRESETAGSSLMNWAQVVALDGGDVWYNALPREIRLRAAADFLTHKTAFYSRDALFHCPNAGIPSTAEVDTFVYFSISMNSKLIGSGGTTLPVTRIKRPSQTVVFLENRVNKSESKVDPAQTDADLGQPSSFANRFAARHAGRGNLAFADGHAEAFKGPSVVETHAGPNRGKAILPQAEIIWTPEPSDNPN
jgi:prepilin-type N-terminal cleavage/methylation domain-containing protein/prepilin-type processing-associated H-X9-DG protein